MKRLLIAVILFCCVIFSVSSQKKSTGGNSSTTKSNTSKSSVKKETPQKTQEIQIPGGLFSVEELERRRKNALEEIELTSSLLKETSASAKSSLNRLNLLSQQLISRKKIVALLGEEISAIDRRIKTMSDEIEILDKDLSKTKENYIKSMHNHQQEHRTTQYKLLLVLSADNMAQSYRRMRYLREYSNWQKEEAGRIVIKQNEIQKRKDELEIARKEKQELFAQRENESKKIESEEQQQQKEVKEINKKQKELQQQLQKKRKEADALNRQIDNLIAEEIENSGKNATSRTTKSTSSETASSGTAPKSNANTSSSNSNYVMTETEVALSNNFANNKGKLPFPLTGKYTIISRFGENQHQELSQVRTVNNGIDLQTTPGAEARAIFKGVVSRVFVVAGYNNNVIIRHGNYLTVYSNISQVYVKAGDNVDTRQPIGKIYIDTEKGNETILHFQIWKERTKLNPTAWIR